MKDVLEKVSALTGVDLKEVLTGTEEAVLALPDHLVQVNHAAVRSKLGELVRGTVEETLNGLLDAEAAALCKAGKYERNEARQDYRAGHYERALQTQAGEVQLKVPKLRTLKFETAIIERYKRREASVEEALIEMYLAGVSVRRVEDITEALWGTKVSPATLSNLNQKVYDRIDEWRNRPLADHYAYVYLDGIVLKRSWAGEVKNVSVLAAIGVNGEGHREVLGVAEGCKEDKAGWLNFLKHLKERGLKGVKLVISDACLGLREALAEVLPETDWQRCAVHWYRNVFSQTPKGKVKEVAAMLKAIHAQEDRAAAERKAQEVIGKLKGMKLPKAAQIVAEGYADTLTYMKYPREHWIKLRTNNPMERILREVRRRARVVGAFPDGQSALMLCAARLRHVAGTAWGTKRYMKLEAEISQDGNEEGKEAASTLIG